MRKRKVQSVDGRTLRSKHSLKSLNCSNHKCNRKVLVDNATESVLCWECVQSKVGIDKRFLTQGPKVVKKDTGFPRGWQFYKQFVHKDGRVFERGKENAKLKGTLPPTEIKKSDLTAGQRKRLREEKKLRKMQRLARKHEKKMKKAKKGNGKPSVELFD